ncbi:MAG: AmmeMemoRadiSam system protein B [Candidatus Omnitrophica bacterium]|jgi:AmmeMemoRadiSam system protein B|nr:AmmeMemoRadiSam system protein B [Candidatus Omnitrophota bacterium]
MIRQAMWAGPGPAEWYPGNPERLNRFLDKFFSKEYPKQDAKAVIVPHAGYVYSGAVAGKTFAHVQVADTVLIIGPNHTGQGSPYSLMRSGAWKNPLGSVPVNETFSMALLENSEFIREDETAHLHEHSIELEIPFLQRANPGVTIVPLVINDVVSSHFKTVGKEIARAIQCYGKPVQIVASSDLTHYEAHEQAQKKDAAAIEAIRSLDEQKLIDTVTALKISMCGLAPVAVMLAACKQLGAQRVDLIEYKTSGDVSGDYSSVVGYAGLIII